MIKDDSKAKCEIIVKDEDSILSDNDIGHVVVPVLHFQDAPIDRWFEINAPPLQHVTGTSSPPPFPSLFLSPLLLSPLLLFPLSSFPLPLAGFLLPLLFTNYRGGTSSAINAPLYSNHIDTISPFPVGISPLWLSLLQ